MRIFFLVCGYGPSFRFRHYSLSLKEAGNIAIMSLRCHREKHYWQVLSKYFITVRGIKIPKWQWVTFAEDCLPSEMRKDASKEGLILTIEKWHVLHPYEGSFEKKVSSVPEETLAVA